MSYTFLPLLGKKEMAILPIATLFLLALISSIDFQYRYDAKEEFALMEWIKFNTPKGAIVSGDDRINGPISAIAERSPLEIGALPSLFLKNIYDKTFRLLLPSVDYVIWSDKYFEQAGLDELATRIKLGQRNKIKFDSSLFDKIYSTSNISLFKVNENYLKYYR